MNFYTLSKEQKLELKKLILEKVELLGSINSFLKLIEEIRASSPHALMASPTKFNGSSGFIKWNKIIFKDKLVLLSQIFNSNSKTILPGKQEKNYKKYLNLLKTLKPIVFAVKPKLRELGDGFEFSIFDYEDDKATSINLIFQVVFFIKMNDVKNLINS